MNASAIAAANVPVLCVDTCSILDIFRDPTRDTQRPLDHAAALDIVTAAEARNLSCLVAEQVSIELSANAQTVEEEAERQLRALRNRVQRINTLSGVHGVAGGVVDFSHLDTYVARTRSLVNRWLAAVETVTPSPLIPGKAIDRVNACIAPATQAKQSVKDCVIYETYLEAIETLRAAGLTAPIVYLSSNLKDYCSESGIVKPAIDADFVRLGVIYVGNISAAKHRLGL
jgi:hypothetical protein